jgi:hypothetical protein
MTIRFLFSPARARLPVMLLCVAFLGGCASFSPDGGLDQVASITRERQGLNPQRIQSDQDAARVADEVKRLLSEPLDVDGAVKIAILNNRGLQANLADLGIAEADLVQAGRLRNPGFTFARLEGGGEREYERKFLFDLMGLLTLSTRSEIEQRRFQATQMRVAEETLRLAQTARQAWFEAVAARQAAQVSGRCARCRRGWRGTCEAHGRRGQLQPPAPAARTTIPCRDACRPDPRPPGGIRCPRTPGAGAGANPGRNAASRCRTACRTCPPA